MRILSFSKKWAKLQNDIVPTFRLPRKDADKGRDWHAGEVVQIVYKSRTPGREILGTATIIGKQATEVAGITDSEAIADGFPGGWEEMVNWLRKTHGKLDLGQEINKLTLKWLRKEPDIEVKS